LAFDLLELDSLLEGLLFSRCVALEDSSACKLSPVYSIMLPMESLRVVIIILGPSSNCYYYLLKFLILNFDLGWAGGRNGSFPSETC